jgi:y4mF family transcriptional regulator
MEQKSQQVVTTTNEIGRIIRKKRKSMGMTQAQAAAHGGVGVRFLSEVENGKMRAEIGKVLQVMNKLGIEMSISNS